MQKQSFFYFFNFALKQQQQQNQIILELEENVCVREREILF